jgi:hypothetical protein
VEPTEFKNVIVENIPPALFADAEVAAVKPAGAIFSTITFLKSVGSTDQNAL